MRCRGRLESARRAPQEHLRQHPRDTDPIAVNRRDRIAGLCGVLPAALIRNQQVGGSIPRVGSIFSVSYTKGIRTVACCVSWV